MANHENPYHGLVAWEVSSKQSHYGQRLVNADTFLSIFNFNSPQAATVPIWALTGEVTCDAPHERKVFRRIEFHGIGSIYVRTYVDGRYISESMVVATETPSKERMLALPRGTRGYSIQLELSGIFELDLIEIGYESFPRTS